MRHGKSSPAVRFPALFSPTVLFCILLAIVPTGLHAQDGGIEEILVTAQKRSQSAIEVPIAMSAYGGQTVRDSGVRDIKDLTILAPSLMVTSSQAESAGTTARIRGIGTTGDNLGLESSVAVFIDGVYRNRNNVALTELGDVERIEVLRGPQGTLFGKNASAGLIHVITRAPDPDDFGGFADLSIGDYGYWRLGGTLNAPVAGEKLALRFDGSVTRRDGFIDDVASGTDYNDRDRYLVRAQAASHLTDNLDLRVIADYSDRSETCCAAVTTIAGPTTPVIGAIGGQVIDPPRPFDRVMTSNGNRGYDQDTEERGISAEFNWDTGIGTLTSITAFRNWEAARSHDADYTSADIVYRDHGAYENDFDTFSQELRLAGETGPVEWLFGLYYVKEELTFLDAVRTGTDYENYANAILQGNLSAITGLPDGGIFVDGQGVVQDRFKQDAESWAVFTHNIWHLTDRWALTLGLRYTDEDKDLSANLQANNPACLSTLQRMQDGIIPPQPSEVLGLVCLPLINPLFDGSYSATHNDEEWTGIVSLSYDITESWLTYASYSRGYKAGGFNLDRGGFSLPSPSAGDLEFDAETVDSWELGAKGYLLDDTMQVSATIFRSEFDDFQLNTFTGTNFIVSNLPGARTKGVELEVLWRALTSLTLQGGATYTDARYDRNMPPELQPAGIDLSGRRITNAPYWIVSAAATWEQPVTGGVTGFVHANYRFTSDLNTGSDLQPQKAQASYAIWNGRIGLRTDDQRWQVELWSQNLFNRDYRQVVIDTPLQTGSYSAFLGDPRTWGATVRLSF